ncbi:Sulfotransferase family protein [Sulfobacillus thermosulfidooxidans DSM 9293]|uniref:Sulfotransferase family protein n=1 Tax=Sulfobacillus thermosulfidooxidans (strain DSM 9293 / VKM B-1269 / AT-1) TaxID=929705 RepID=A0A1W1WC73_SULTA|nr:hypothetical protein [Sulfobacillus thermosulfidooxidans]SMC03918.1 Sulfotransferase family protein [Sulfobacillus thermosulfidooxidans DSM 9293]
MIPNIRRAIVVLGMHRSGTSVIAAGLRVLGVDWGRDDEFLPLATDNPKGHFEWADVVYWHEVLLAVLGRRWNDWAALPPEWLDQPSVQAVAETMTALVRQRFGEHTLWGFKDPRTCLFVPLWERIFSRLDVVPNYVVVIRHPLSVAYSLQRRDGMTLAEGLQLWMRYVMDSLQSTHGARRVIVDYDDWLADPIGILERVARMLDLAWPPDPRLVSTYCNEFVDENLRHDKRSWTDMASSPDVPPYVATTYATLVQASRVYENDSHLADRLRPARVQWQSDAGWVYAGLQHVGRQLPTVPLAYLEVSSTGTALLARTLLVPHHFKDGLWSAAIRYTTMFPVRQIRLILPPGTGVLHRLQLTVEGSHPNATPAVLQVAGVVPLTRNRWGKLTDPAWLQWTDLKADGNSTIHINYLWEPASAEGVVHAVHDWLQDRHGN